MRGISGSAGIEVTSVAGKNTPAAGAVRRVVLMFAMRLSSLPAARCRVPGVVPDEHA
jgi:hypothetical protein